MMGGELAAALHRVFLGLGVLLGIATPSEAPVIAALAYRDATYLYVNVAIDNAYPPASLELAKNGTRVAYRLDATLQSPQGVTRMDTIALRCLRYDMMNSAWSVRVEGERDERHLKEREAAIALAAGIWRCRVCPVSTLDGGGELYLTLHSGILDSDGAWHDAELLWGYKEPSFSLRFLSLQEVPF